MKRITFFLCATLLYTAASYGQLYSTKTGFIGFYSKTPLEDVKAENNQVYAVLDMGKKNIAFSLLMKNFIFPRQLMQTHFNENYAESDKYPKASFSGSFAGNVDVNKEAVYRVVVKGQLTLHGVTRPLETPATLEVKGGKITGQAEFKVKPDDYKIAVPSILWNKIAKEITVKVKIDCTNTK
jgi:hypothetical protein